MATRSRTLLFLQFRNSYSGTHAATLRQQYSQVRQQEQLPPYESNERVGLMDGAETAIEMMMLPPKW